MFNKFRKLQRQDGDSVSADTPGAVATSPSPSAVAPPHQEPVTIQNDDSSKQTTGSPAPANPYSSSSSSSLSSPSQSSQHVPSKSILNLDTANIKSASTLLQRVSKKHSWYGSLPHKATAASSVTHETIRGDTFQPPTATTTANISRLDRTIKHATSIQSLRPSSKGIMSANLPSGQTAKSLINENSGFTDANLTSGSTSTETSPIVQSQMKPVTSEEHGETEGVQRSKVGDGPGPAEQIDEMAGADADATDRDGAAGDETVAQDEIATPTEVGWFGWLWGQMVDEASSSSDQSNQEPQQGDEMEVNELEALATQTESPFTESANTESQASMSYVSWLGSFWHGSETAESTPQDSAGKEHVVCNETSLGAAEAEIVSGSPPATMSTTAADMAKMPLSNSIWAFWLRQPKEDNEGQKKAYDGELAVMGEASEDDPTTVSDIEAPKKAKEKLSLTASIVETKKRQRTPDPDTPASFFSKSPSTASLASESSDMTTPANSNILLPSFTSTYKPEPTPSLVSQITNLILRPASANPAPLRHVFRTAAPPELPIRKAISIGVHGLFPAAYLRPMVGQPTGTSLRFANLGAKAISRWTGRHGFGDCVIDKVVLESKGRIMERVDNLWKLLLNWLDELKEADLILVSCHSQGVPVGIMLVAKLLGLGVIGNGTRIGICAMAGVCGGPFPDYKASIGMFMGSAAELWEFSRPDSAISSYLEHSLKAILHWGVRITFVGSMDDQVVPMESAVFSSAHHPYIYRAVFIDGRLHTPDFIANLVGFALKLRNLGVPDHGLIRELSIPLAGSLYSGEGHSRLYYDDQVYDLALANALETTRMPGKGVECVMGNREGLTEGNPYVLPWVLRGVLEEGGRDAGMKKEVERLVELFESWRPGTKALKDVKYRLEAVRSKL